MIALVLAIIVGSVFIAAIVIWMWAMIEELIKGR